MQLVLERDKHLTFDVGLIQLIFIPVCSPNTCNISVKLRRGFALHSVLFIEFGKGSGRASSSALLAYSGKIVAGKALAAQEAGKRSTFCCRQF